MFLPLFHGIPDFTVHDDDDRGDAAEAVARGRPPEEDSLQAM